MLRTEMGLLETWNDKYLILETISEITNDTASIWFMPCMRLLVQTEAERRRREAGVKQSMELGAGSCLYVYMYGIWDYLANQGI